jgi:hypothetical protein
MTALKNIDPRLDIKVTVLDAAFSLVFLDPDTKSESTVQSKEESKFDYSRFALWLTYKLITINHNPSDKQIIFYLKSKFDIRSEVTVKCLKALDLIFEATNSFRYNRNEKCKRYSTHNKNQDIIMAWCLSYQEANPETKFLQSRLKIK